LFGNGGMANGFLPGVGGIAPSDGQMGNGSGGASEFPGSGGHGNVGGGGGGGATLLGGLPGVSAIGADGGNGRSLGRCVPKRFFGKSVTPHFDICHTARTGWRPLVVGSVSPGIVLLTSRMLPWGVSAQRRSRRLAPPPETVA
jgi:hypothetical protein